ncbi:MAG: aconitase family protein, partial [Acidobacteria bacterium]|nr:aconitase family protein [Acidobacteriota bacterium]MDW7985566.1 aconitase family protein [Acidobacteriota bacterium]
YLPPDDAVFDWLAERLARRTGRPVAECRDRISAGALYPDPDARYVAEYTVDLDHLEPLVACPHDVDQVRPLREVAGTPIDYAFIGTCTNGRIEDIAAAVEVLRGRQVAPGVRLLVIPASQVVLQEAVQRGYLATLIEAGAVIGVPGCGPCMGNHMGIPAAGEVVIASMNRNYRGRMGPRDVEIYLASPAVVAASAVTGVITDPREVVG